MIRTAIIEDDPELRKFMEEALATSPDIFLAGSYSNAEDFKKIFTGMPI
jgi:chemotaxis response regulator CheB